MNNRFKYGIFVISLDFELYWGVRDKRSLDSYKSHLLNTPGAVLSTLNLFRRYDIHATWATVGALFLSSQEEFLATASARPGYRDSNLCPYAYAEKQKSLDPPYHFAPDLIESIASQPGQEIGTHTFSHYYCAEEGASPSSFSRDIQQARRTAEKMGIPLRSIVFPRNQWREEFLPSLKEARIGSFRGNPPHWAYRSAAESEQSLPRRAFRLIDSYLNLTGHHTFAPPRARQGLMDVPASAFLRPYSRKLACFEPLKIKRIQDSLTIAARRREGYHLWWHPHNFGSHLEENLANLETILATFDQLRNSYGMISRNMLEVEQGTKDGSLLDSERA
ncbi:MAG TPA: hypothetical protein EYO33_15775 [Phycisphaerales bacterium]|nr:hypothetical protein [Phycisphaerales bacterium]